MPSNRRRDVIAPSPVTWSSSSAEAGRLLGDRGERAVGADRVGQDARWPERWRRASVRTGRAQRASVRRDVPTSATGGGELRWCNAGEARRVAASACAGSRVGVQGPAHGEIIGGPGERNVQQARLLGLGRLRGGRPVRHEAGLAPTRNTVCHSRPLARVERQQLDPWHVAAERIGGREPRFGMRRRRRPGARGGSRAPHSPPPSRGIVDRGRDVDGLGRDRGPTLASPRRCPCGTPPAAGASSGDAGAVDWPTDRALRRRARAARISARTACVRASTAT